MKNRIWKTLAKVSLNSAVEFRQRHLFRLFRPLWNMHLNWQGMNELFWQLTNILMWRDHQKALQSTLQMLIDKYKDSTKLMLILCGSSMSYMEDHVLAYKAPLYGRRPHR